MADAGDAPHCHYAAPQHPLCTAGAILDESHNPKASLSLALEFWQSATMRRHIQALEETGLESARDFHLEGGRQWQMSQLRTAQKPDR
ncbi:hypothetical protein [Neorhizobium tomejilense]|uniref:hypothetical protein n=1 Tax=Neorhizobium tomejilense TaxID=2093828 RepID=UPI003ECDBED9